MILKEFIILIPIIAGVLYHLGQKSLSGNFPGTLLFVFVYTISAIAMLISYFAFERNETFKFAAMMTDNWPNILLITLGIIGVELGYLFVYRSGLPMSTSALISNTGIGIFLLVIGIVAFGEKLSMENFIGLVLAMAGMFLLRK